MNIIAPNFREIAYKQCLELIRTNPLVMANYYTQLITTFRSLLNDEDEARMLHILKEIEDWLSDDLNKITLQEAEYLMYNNNDLKSGFEVNGKMITQLEINQRLQELKNWLMYKLYEYLPSIRFTQQVQIVQ